MRRLALGFVMLLGAAACSGSKDLKDPPVPLGDFNLEHNIVVASKAYRGPLSREVSEEELASTMHDAIAERFDRYNGDSKYHFGVSVEGYVLAVPGVPVVASPKSILIINLTVWDDAAGKKLNEEPKQITVFETFGTDLIIGSGYTMSAEEQLVILSQNAAKAIENYLVEQRAEQGWFTPDTVAAPTAGANAVPAPEG